MAGKKGGSRLNVAIIHPDRGIGGAEKLIVDAAVELASHASVSGVWLSLLPFLFVCTENSMHCFREK
ncbi:hypothetical protein DVH24_003924 [Malus domestica]|uniref:Uncharacterized protein n=1 Tax=Malus domestica TaxID=3750 RepID=A0A498KCR3_MALDO|nr:hypothetical protein DVH24_003924 [Malus domestica]